MKKVIFLMTADCDLLLYFALLKSYYHCHSYFIFIRSKSVLKNKIKSLHLSDTYKLTPHKFLWFVFFMKSQVQNILYVKLIISFLLIILQRMYRWTFDRSNINEIKKTNYASSSIFFKNMYQLFHSWFCLSNKN